MHDVMVCFALPERAWMKKVRANAMATVFETVLQSGFFKDHPNVSPESLSFGVFGQSVLPDTLVGQGDRIEIYRPLNFDPKESRRRRAAHRAAKQKRQSRIDPMGRDAAANSPGVALKPT